MADGTTAFFVANVTHLITYNVELVGDSKNQVKELLTDLDELTAIVKAYTEQHFNDPVLKVQVNKIRSVVEQGEDFIEKFFVENAIYKAKSIRGRALYYADHQLTIRKIAKEIERIREKVTKIDKHIVNTALQQGSLHASLQKLIHGQRPVVETDNVVGFDEQAEVVISRLIRVDNDLDIIKIIGMPGIGKTTLAWKIYNHPTIKESFCRAWVFVSQKYSKKEVILSILNFFEKEKNYADKPEDIVYVELRQYLLVKKYLIVMDDVWTKEVWDDLKSVFPDNKNGSRILLTSRIHEVAWVSNPTKDSYHLKFLTKDESWELLKKKVFGKEKCPDKDLEDVGVLIASACKGLPLAIVLIARILLKNLHPSVWWNQVARNVMSFIVDDQRNLLVLSYHDLPHYLKPCFIYLGIFPEDCKIPVSKLILLWIAEGFIVSERQGNSNLEELAEAWVRDLVQKNLLMVAESRSNGQIKTCRIHNILHAFCKNEARKQNLYQEEKDLEQQTSDNYRRICLHSDVESYLSSKPSGDHVRSFLSFAPNGNIFQEGLLSGIPKAFELLRVLEIRSTTFPIFPKDILELVLLRYIAITCDSMTLPATISRLWNMQTMILLTNSRMLKLKDEMWKMDQLRHLHTNACALLPPPPSNLQKSKGNVQSLSMISPESCTKEVFARTPNIRKLGVRGKLDVFFSNFFVNVGGLQHLTNLKLINDVNSNQTSQSKISSLPPFDIFPILIERLTLSRTLLDWKLMSILGKLVKLEVLKLKDNAFGGQLWVPEDGGFESLKYLHIGKTDLVNWEASQNHFPRLKRLVLRHCVNLVAVPSEFSDIASFQVLELYLTNPSAETSARVIEERKNLREVNNTNPFVLIIDPPLP